MTAIALSGAAVAITGGARGIGLATAKEFVGRGARVYIGDLDANLAKDRSSRNQLLRFTIGRTLP